MEEELKIKQTLSQFPSSFDVLNDVQTSSRELQMTTLEKLTRELDECSLDIDIETTRTWNLISFLCFLVGEKEDAVYYNIQVKENDVCNIIANTNRAWFYYKDEDVYECNKICQQLENDKPSKLQLLKAKAEIAYTYTRLGVHLYKKAEDRYVKVLQESNDISSVPMEYICVWKFGLALILNRQFNMTNWYSDTDIEIYKRNARAVLLLYHEISLMTGETLCKYRARANIEIGLLVDNKERYEKWFSIDIFSEIKSEFQLESSVYYIKLAKEICPHDVFVLERSGKYYRYQRDEDESISLLQNALSIRETSFGHHHLALSLIQKATNQRKHNTGKQVLYRRNDNILQMDERGVKTDIYDNKPAINVQYKRDNKPIQFKAESKNTPHKADTNDCKQGLKQPFSNLKAENKTCRDSPGIEMPKTNTKFYTNLTTSASIPELTETKLTTHQIVKHRFPETTRTRSLLTSDLRIEITDSTIKTVENDKNKWKTVNRKQRRFSHTGEDSSNRQIHRHDVYKNTSPERRYASVKPEKNYSKNEYYTDITTMVKSPRFLPTLPDDSLNNAIFEHLDKAFSISKFNTSALYDKGLMLRRINKPQEALCIFKQIMKEKCSIIQLSNTYEQAAFCLMDTERSSLDYAEQDKTDYYVKRYLNKSIETSCNMVSSLPALKDCWSTVPTLKSMILGQTQTKHTSKELSQLNERIGNHGEAIGLYNKQIADLDDDEDEKAEVYMKIVNNYVKDKNVDKAVLTCELIMCLPNGIKKIDPFLYCSVNVNAGLDALMKEEQEMSRLRFQNALYFGKRLSQSSNCSDRRCEDNNNALRDDDREQEFDIFILCDEDEEEKGRKVKSDLETAGLKVTINSDAVTYGHTEISGIVRVMKHSNHFVVVVCEENKTQYTGLEEIFYLGMRDIQKEHPHKNIVVVLEEPLLKVSPILAMQPRISMSNNDTLNQQQRLWLNDLLLMLATGKQLKTHEEATEA